MPSRELELSTLVTVQAAAPPVGLLEVTTLPLLSTATQRPLLGQDTANWRSCVLQRGVYLGHRPGRRAPGGVAGGEHVAAAVHGDAEAAAGTGHAA